MALYNTDHTKEGTLDLLMPRVKKIYFIGIGGVSMCVLAKMCAARGYTVMGSDSACNEGVLSLSLAGIPVFTPDKNTPIIDADLAVYTGAIKKDHPEYKRAVERGIPLVSRADFLGWLMKGYRERIGIAGTHGKSTVSAMCTAIAERAGAFPTAAVGAAFPHRQDGYWEGKEDLFIFEACEYYDAFLRFCPTVATLTNAEWDHPDYFSDLSSVIASFRAYLSLPSVKTAIVGIDCQNAVKVSAGIPKTILTFGLSGGADVSAVDLRNDGGNYRFTLTVNRERIGTVKLKVPGKHNVENALAATASALAVGISPDNALLALSDFSGVGRRGEFRGELYGVAYYDDYAHHPTEIRATLASLKGSGRLFCIFQPHTFSRTKSLFAETASALSLCDVPIVVGIYAAREGDEGAVNGLSLAKAIGKGARYFETPEEAIAFAKGEAKAGDRIVVMGAGDISARVFRGELSFPDTP